MTSREEFDQFAERLVTTQADFDPRRYADILRRRYLYLLVPAVVIFGVVYWIAQVLPPVYQARATILVESQQIPTALAQPTVSANAGERIQLIEQRLMARDNLLAIADKFALYSGQRLSPTEIVGLIRDATNIRQIDVGNRAQGNALGFTVSFENGDPNAAVRVTNEFVTSILQQNIQSRSSRASETAKFFEQQVAQVQQELAAQGARIVEFKNNNQGSLPETLGSRQALFQQLQGQVAEIDGRVAVLETQRQLWAERGPTALDPRANSTETQLSQLRLQLVQLRAVLADTHPDVRAVVAKIDALEQASAVRPSGSAGNGEAGEPADAGGSDDIRLADIDSQLETLRAQRAALETRLVALDEASQRTPQVEVALNVLMRDYEGFQAQYREARAKLANAATGERLEEDRQAERFEVVEQATVGSQPVRPNRKRIVFAGSFGGVMAGMGLVMLLEVLDRSIRGAADLERRLHIRPISSIPYVRTNEERNRRRQFWMAVLVAAAAFGALALVLVQIFYLPLDLVAEKVIQRLGSLTQRLGF